MRTHHVRRIGIGLPLLGVLALACGGDPAETAPATIAVSARLAQAERVAIPGEVEVQGSVEAARQATVSTRVMAMVSAIHVRAGDHVRSGELLLEIDPQTARGQLAQAEGALGQARAALALAQRNYERYQGLAESRAASELEVDMAEMQHEQAKGAVEQAEGAVAAARSVAADTRIVAPFAGRVARRMVDIGDLAAPGRPLIAIESDVGRRLVIAVPETLMHEADLGVGDSLRVRIDALAGAGELQGTIAEMTPGADPVSHSFEIKLDLTGATIPSGSAGRAWIQTRPRPAVVVPAEAVLRQGGMALVVIRTAAGGAGSRVVTIGRELPEDRVEILSGLTGGETILVGLAAVPPTGAAVEAPR